MKNLTKLFLLSSALFLHGCFVDISLTVTVEGEGQVNGSSIDCGEDCDVSYSLHVLQGFSGVSQTVQFNATAAPGWEFYGWRGSFLQCDYQSPDCQVSLGLNLIDPYDDPLKASNYYGTEATAQAIFVPQGNVVEFDWDNQTTCYIDTANAIHCWGMENGPILTSPSNLQVATRYGCAMDGQDLHCWGSTPSIPQNVQALSYTAERQYACIININNEVQCFENQITGDKPYLNIPELDTPTALWSLGTQVCADTVQGIVCWGNNLFGQAEAPSVASPISVSASYFQSCAVSQSSGLICWGEDKDYSNFTQLMGHPQAVQLINHYNGGICIKDSSLWRCTDISGNERMLLDVVQQANKIDAGSDYICGNGPQGFGCNYTLGSADTNIPTAMQTPDDFSTGGGGLCTLTGRYIQCTGYYDWLLPDQFVTRKRSSLQQPSVITSNNYVICVGGADGVECLFEEDVATPTPDLHNVTHLASTPSTVCAISDEGVSCWGNNNHGQESIPPLINPTQLSVGTHHVCALDDSGVVCWGEKLTKD